LDDKINLWYIQTSCCNICGEEDAGIGSVGKAREVLLPHIRRMLPVEWNEGENVASLRKHLRKHMLKIVNGCASRQIDY
jgi:hypothetical protein